MSHTPRVSTKTEIYQQFINQRKLDIETEYELLTMVEQMLSGSKKPRRDLSIVRPPQTVIPVSDKVWQATIAGINEFFQQVEQDQNVAKAPANPPTDEFDLLLEHADQAITNAIASQRTQQQQQQVAEAAYVPNC